MYENNNIEKVKRLCPPGFDYIKWEDNVFINAFLSCFDNYLVTIILGPGGSGKSEIYKMVAEHYRDKALCLATTGKAATNLETAHVTPRTIHSGLGIPLYPYYSERCFFKKIVDVLSKKDVLMIDEVSMLSSNLLDLILRHVKFVNSRRNGKKLKMILTGDQYQLPAVFDRERLLPVINDHPNLERKWGFTRSKELVNSLTETYELNKIYRQADPFFKAVLENIRVGKIGNSELEFINKRVSRAESDTLIVASTNKIVDELNQDYVNKLKKSSLPFIFDATVFIDGIITDSNFSDHIELYEGERVIITRNIYEEDNTLIAANGTCGNIAYFQNNGTSMIPVVHTDAGKDLAVPFMKYDEIELRKNEFGDYESVVTACAYQLPIKACRAMTTHKVQGMTLDKIHVIPPQTRVLPGQMYVALSRVRSPMGLSLESPISKEMIRAPRI